jgi:hypothetical protein
MEGKLVDNPKVLLGLFFMLGMGASPVARLIKAAFKPKKKAPK